MLSTENICCLSSPSKNSPPLPVDGGEIRFVELAAGTDVGVGATITAVDVGAAARVTGGVGVGGRTIVVKVGVGEGGT